MLHRFTVYALAFAVFLLTNRTCFADDTTVPVVDLTEQNYASWRDHILPAKSDLGWQQIPWLATFQDGILSANQRKRPLLFWTMNGHPLGCT